MTAHVTEDESPQLDQAPRFSLIQGALLAILAFAIPILAGALRERDLIPNWAYYLSALGIVGCIAFVYPSLGIRRRSEPLETDLICDLCRRNMKRYQIEQIPPDSPHKCFPTICRRCRTILFQQGSFQEQFDHITRRTLPLFLALSLLCLAGIGLQIFAPLAPTPPEDLVAVELQILRVGREDVPGARAGRGRPILEAVRDKQPVSFYLPTQHPITQRFDKLERGTYVTALVEDQTIVQITKNGTPVFTYQEIQQQKFGSWVTLLVILFAIAILPIGWYVYRERPRVRRRLQHYRDRIEQLPVAFERLSRTHSRFVSPPTVSQTRS